MSFRYFPEKLLAKITPEAKIEKLLSGKVTLKKAALSFVDDIDFIDKSKVAEVALKTVKGYKKRIKADKDVKAEILDDPKQLIQRVQNEVVFQVAEGIKEEYSGDKYTWLPSEAEEPDPEHQLKYGKTFTVGVGEMPGDRYGCRCGMEIHSRDKTLKL